MFISDRSDAVSELFDFQDTLSPVSQAYHKALAMILDNEVKVLLLSSLNDQVVRDEQWTRLIVLRFQYIRHRFPRRRTRFCSELFTLMEPLIRPRTL